MDDFNRYIASLLCLLAFASCLCVRTRAIEPNATARAAILIDAQDGKVLYEKNSDARLQMASTTKIMTTLLTIESGDLDSYFTVDSDAIKVEGSSMGLREGKQVTKRMLAFGMMLPSGNDAANAAAVKVGGSIDGFVDLMNRRAKDIGLENTSFVTPSGLDDYTDEHYSTAYDMAMLTREALKNDIFRNVCATRSICLEYGDGEECWLSNTNRLLSSCEGVIGVKTGFTDKAGRCLVSACERNGATLICVTLNDPNDWYDHNRLYEYGFGLMEKRELDGISLKLPCVGGEADYIPVKSEGFSLTMQKEDFERIETIILLPRFLYLPVNDGESVGRVIYKLDGRVLCNKELIAERSVAEK